MSESGVEGPLSPSTNPLREEQGLAQRQGSFEGRKVNLSTAEHLALTKAMKKAGGDKSPTTTLTVGGRKFKLEMHTSISYGIRIIINAKDKTPIGKEDVQAILVEAKRIVDENTAKKKQDPVLQYIANIRRDGVRTRPINKKVLEETKKLLDQYKANYKKEGPPPSLERRFFSRAPLPKRGDVEERIVSLIRSELPLERPVSPPSPIAHDGPAETPESKGNSPADAATLPQQEGPPQEERVSAWRGGTIDRAASSPTRATGALTGRVDFSRPPNKPLPIPARPPVSDAVLTAPSTEQRASDSPPPPASAAASTKETIPESAANTLPPSSSIPEEVASVHGLRIKLTSLGRTNKLIWKDDELSVVPRDFSLQSRTGASSNAQTATEECLKTIQKLLDHEQVTTNLTAMKDLQEGLLALVASEWFRGVIEHHGEELNPSLLETIKKFCEKLPEEEQTSFLAGCAATMARVEELRQFARTLPKEILGRDISEKINEIRRAFTAGQSSKTSLEEIKDEIDSLKGHNPELAKELYEELLGIIHDDAFIEATRRFLNTTTDRESLQTTLSTMVRLAEPTRQTPLSAREQQQQQKLTELRDACAQKYCNQAEENLTSAVHAKDAETIYTILREIRDLQTKGPDPQTERNLDALQKKLMDLVKASREMFETLKTIVAPTAEDRKKIAEGALEETGKNFEFFQQQIINEQDPTVRAARMCAVAVSLIGKAISSKEEETHITLSKILERFFAIDAAFLSNDPEGASLFAQYVAAQTDSRAYASMDRSHSVINVSPDEVKKASEQFAKFFNEPLPDTLSEGWREKADRFLLAAQTLDASTRYSGVPKHCVEIAEKTLSHSLDAYKDQNRERLEKLEQQLKTAASKLDEDYRSNYEAFQKASQDFHTGLEELFFSDKSQEINRREHPIANFVSRYRASVEEPTSQYSEIEIKARELYFESEEGKKLLEEGKQYIQSSIEKCRALPEGELRNFVLSDDFMDGFKQKLGNPSPSLLSTIEGELFETIINEKKESVDSLAEQLKRSYSEKLFEQYSTAVKELFLISNIRWSGKYASSLDRTSTELDVEWINPLFPKRYDLAKPLAAKMHTLSEETKHFRRNTTEQLRRLKKNKSPDALEKSMKAEFEAALTLIFSVCKRISDIPQFKTMENLKQAQESLKTYGDHLLGQLSLETQQKFQASLSAQKTALIVQDTNLTPEMIISSIDMRKIEPAVDYLLSAERDAYKKSDQKTFEDLGNTVSQILQWNNILNNLISSCSDEGKRTALIERYDEFQRIAEKISTTLEEIKTQKNRAIPPLGRSAVDIPPPSSPPASEQPVVDIPPPSSSPTPVITPPPTEKSTSSSVKELHDMLAQLGEDNEKLTLDEMGELGIKERERGFYVRTGASEGARQAAFVCLNKIKGLWKNAGEGDKKLLQESLITFMRSEWFRGVVSNHPEMADALFAMVKSLETNKDLGIILAEKTKDVSELSQFHKLFHADYGQDVKERWEEFKGAVLTQNLNAADFRTLTTLKRGFDTLEDVAQQPKETAEAFSLGEQFSSIAKELPSQLTHSLREKLSHEELAAAVSLATALLKKPSQFPKASIPPLEGLKKDLLDIYTKKISQELGKAAEDGDFKSVLAILEEIQLLTKDGAGDDLFKREEIASSIGLCIKKIVDIISDPSSMDTTNANINALGLAISQLPEEQKKAVRENPSFLTAIFQGKIQVSAKELAPILAQKVGDPEAIRSCLHAQPLDVLKELCSDETRKAMSPDEQKRFGKIIKEIRASIIRGEILEGSRDFATLSLLADKDPRNLSLIIKELFDSSEKAKHKTIGEFALLWAQECQHVVLPSTEEKRRAFEKNIGEVRSQLNGMASILEGEGSADLAQKLKEASETFCTAIDIAETTPGEESVDSLINLAMEEGETSTAYKDAVDKIANDFFSRSADCIRPISPLGIFYRNEVSPKIIGYSLDTKLYIESSILQQESLEKAQKTIFFWLAVGEKVLQLGDQTTAAAIVGALQSAGVSRLYKDKSNYRPGIEANHQKRLDAFLKDDFKKYNEDFIKQRLAQKQPIIPFILPLYADLEHLENFFSYTLYEKNGRHIRQIKDCQKTIADQLQQITDLQTKLADVRLRALKGGQKWGGSAAQDQWDKEMFARSQKLAPREER